MKFRGLRAGFHFRSAETAAHHPDITFGWGFVDIALTAHDRGGITDVDIALAGRIDELLGRP